MAVVRLLVHGRDIGFSCLAPTCFFINLNTSEGRTDRIFGDAPLKPFRSRAGQSSGTTVPAIRTRFYWQTLKRVTPINFVSSVRMPSKIGSICWCWLLKRQLRVQTTPRISCLLNESFVRPLDSCNAAAYGRVWYIFQCQIGFELFPFITRPCVPTRLKNYSPWTLVIVKHKMILNAG